MFARNFFTNVDSQPIIDGVFRALEKIGVLCENEKMLNKLEVFGARVDKNSMRVRFPRQLVSEFVALVQKETAESKENAPEHPGFTPAGTPQLGTQIAQVYYDWKAHERRGANRRDFIECIKLASMLNKGSAGHCLVQANTNARLESLESALVLAEYAEFPQAPFAWYEEQIDYLLEMGEILGIPHWFTYGANCFAHPFRLDKTVADKFHRRILEGDAATFTAMPVAGMSTPITIEGFITVATAEYMAVWLAGRALNSNCGLGGSMWAGIVDMKSGAVNYAAYDGMMRGIACSEFIRDWLGIRVTVGGGDYTDAREPGMAAAFEKAYKAMTIAAFTGIHPSVGQGLLECGRTLCPVQLILERDMALGTRQYAQPICPTAERIGADWIEMVDLGLENNHLSTEQTLNEFRSLWFPDVINRKGWNGAQGDHEILERAQGKIDDLVADYRKPEGRDAKLAEMRKVLERARRALC